MRSQRIGWELTRFGGKCHLSSLRSHEILPKRLEICVRSHKIWIARFDNWMQAGGIGLKCLTKLYDIPRGFVQDQARFGGYLMRFGPRGFRGLMRAGGIWREISPDLPDRSQDFPRQVRSG